MGLTLGMVDRQYTLSPAAAIDESDLLGRIGDNATELGLPELVPAVEMAVAPA